jgi:predicted dehydrogenase
VSTPGRPVRILLAGAGARGAAYARLAHATGRAAVVGIAEPVEARREGLADELGVPPDGRFAGWQSMLARERFADAVVIATQDREHYEPFVEAARRGYAILLEKPIAVTRRGCRELAAAAQAYGVSASVCHVLRYTPVTAAVRALIAAGEIGRVVSVQHLEPVGYWHFAHSYVRGNWRREDLSSPFLLAKCTHDVDWLTYVVGSRPVRVSSFGSLSHFRPDEAPAGAGERCTDCAVEATCPYSALRIYGAGRAGAGAAGESGTAAAGAGEPTPGELAPSARRAYFTEIVDPGGTPETLRRALETGPYGRCVYRSDNDAVDHQVVAIEYENGTTATLTATAFTEATARRTRIFGTHGEAEVDENGITVHDFLTGRTRAVAVDGQAGVPAAALGGSAQGGSAQAGATSAGATAAEGHGGGDRGLIEAWVASLAEGRGGRISSSLAESLVSHEAVFAAEEARHTGRVVHL